MNIKLTSPYDYIIKNLSVKEIDYDIAILMMYEGKCNHYLYDIIYFHVIDIILIVWLYYYDM